MQKIVIPRPIIEQLESHARGDSPNECCGMLGGCEGRVQSCYQLRNLSATPEKNYFASPEDLFRTMRQMRAAGEQLIAIYHSHPAGAAFPSRTDIDLAYYPEVAHLVVSLVPEVKIRAFMIRNRIVEAVAIEASEE